MKEYPKYKDETNVPDILRVIVSERKSDIKDFDNLRNIFISGRKVGKIPTGATNIDANDRLGDFNYTSGYIYICVDNSGTAEWRRVALASW